MQSSNGTLTLNGAPFRFGGTNSYPLMYSNSSTVDQILQTVASSNLKVVRMWVFCDTTCGNDFFFQTFNTTTRAPAYNDVTRGLDNVDLAVNEANTLGIKLILTLTNNWTDFGGMDTYVKWHNGQYHDQFYTDPTILQWYENWVSHVLNHVNTVQGPSFGVAYKNDPTIMAWELANEPECGGSGPPNGLPTSGNCNTQTIVNWITEAASYIKTVDSNHLVAVGDEGFICDPSSCSNANGVDSASFSGVADVDFVGFHLYPDSWGWSIAESDTFIANQESIATNLGKPLYMGEFGLLSGNAKELIYNDWTNRIFSGGGSGAMFWDVLPGVPTPANAESASTFDEYAGSPVLPLMSDFAETMAGSTQQLPPVAGYQWASAPLGQPATLNVLSNDVAYGENVTIDPATINLDPGTPVPQTTSAVNGGVFSVAAGTVQFAPQAGFVGTAYSPYTVEDSNHQVSNVGYMFVTVNPAQTGWAILDSFESGSDGWGPGPSPAAGTVALSPIFHTDGSYSLEVNVTAGGWFGVTFPAPVDLSNQPSLAVDVGTTSVGTYSAFAFQSGSGSVWCQNATWEALNLFSTTTLTVELQSSALQCYGGTQDLSSVRTMYVYFGNPGTYYLDDLRAGPASGAAALLPAIAGIGNAASGQAGLSAGTYFSIYGSNLAPAGTAMTWSNSIVNGQLPNKLAGVSVSVGGTPGYLSYVSPGQINVLAPNLGAGPTAVTVTTSAGTSEPYIMTAPALQPAFFELTGTSYVVATDTNYNPLASNGTIPGRTTVPARPGEIIILWGTGFGPTTPAAPAGQVVPPNSYSVNGVTVAVGSVQANVLATALSQGLAGVYQVAITVPSSLANGDYPIVATVGGVQSPSGVNLTVQQ